MRGGRSRAGRGSAPSRLTMRALLLCLLALPGVTSAQAVSFTFDDGFDPRQEPEAARLNAELLAALRRHDVGAMIFPAGRNVDTAEGLALVKAWGEAGHAVGNHTYSHRNLDSARVTLEEFVRDVEAGDRLFGGLPRFTPMLRFPFLKEGNTAEKRDGVRDWLRRRGYRPAYVSIDTSDWYYDQRYRALLKDGRHGLVPVLRQAYLDHLRDRARYYDGLARATLSRSPAHVMLLHTNAVNAAFIGDAVTMFKAAGWTVVSPATAFEDPVYSQAPATLPAGESVVWSLAHAAGTQGLRYPAEDGEYEKPMLDGLGL